MLLSSLDDDDDDDDEDEVVVVVVGVSSRRKSSLSLSLARASSEYRALQTRRLCLSKVPNTTTLCSSERRNRNERLLLKRSAQQCEKSGVFF